MSDDPERMNTYLKAISALSPLGQPEHWVKFSTRVAIAEACMAVADGELLAKDETIEYWQASVTARDETIERLSSDRNHPYGDVADGVSEVEHLERVERQRAEALATIERVRALMGDTDGPLWSVRGVREADLRAALEGSGVAARQEDPGDIAALKAVRRQAALARRAERRNRPPS